MTRAAQKHFVEQKYGKVLNLSSVTALGNRGQANYSAAKMGIQGFTRTLASSWARSASTSTPSRRASSPPR